MYATLCGEGARQLIWILDVVQEYRDLCQSEFQLKSDLKNWFFFGLTTIEKLRAKQQSRLMTIKAAEASLRLFFMQERLGLAARWSVWVTTLLATASSSVFLNGC